MRNYLQFIMYTKGITYRQLSKLSGVSIGGLHNIAMLTSDPTQSTMIAIARGLNMEVTDVFNLKYKWGDKYGKTIF